MGRISNKYRGNRWRVKMKGEKEEKELKVLCMKELIAKIELYLSLEEFCDSVGEECFNLRSCDECSIKEKRDKLKEEIMLSC
ncbi:MAG: hypothetical protein ACPLKS_04720 [Caldisericum exile]|uniref:hypothetical protein n=1 Tax=Caldisericum exile TaxID=693075 RepID=UPI003C78D4BF